jgi:deoxyguanosine kinase
MLLPDSFNPGCQADAMYVAIEGVIGVGKTTLGRLLRPLFDAELLLEEFEENPFLSKFYADRNRYAFQTQICFLLSRYRQQRQGVPQALTRGSLIADYTFEKDALFAQLNLSGDELTTYQLVHDALAERIPLPDLIVYLQVDTDIALKRIATRDRTYERDMDRDYIDALNRAYEEHFTNYMATRLLVIDSSSLDFVANGKDLNSIEQRVRHALEIPPIQPSLPFGASPSAG